MSNFIAFWSAYPNRKGKGAAEKKYQKITQEEHTAILLAIDAQKRYRVAAKKTGEFMPEWCMPATWLNQQRWLDEIPSHAEIKEKQNLNICCIPDCNTQVYGKRFATCEYHYQHNEKGRLRQAQHKRTKIEMNLVGEVRAAYDPNIAGRPKSGPEALRWALERMK